MSYCRWSSDDYQCDVYCYEHCNGGFETNVASFRYVFDEPLPPNVSLEHEGWLARYQKVMEMVDLARLQPIGLSQDGQTFHDSTAEDTANRLQWLKDMGYVVPQYAIDALREESGT